MQDSSSVEEDVPEETLAKELDELLERINRGGGRTLRILASSEQSNDNFVMESDCNWVGNAASMYIMLGWMGIGSSAVALGERITGLLLISCYTS